MSPDPITPDTSSLMKLFMTVVKIAGGLGVIAGVVKFGVDWEFHQLIKQEVKDDKGVLMQAIEDEMEDHVVELAQTVVDDDILVQQREIDLLKERIERLENR